MEKITAEWGAGRGLARCFRGARISKDPPETTREATGQASVPPPQDWKEKHTRPNVPPNPTIQFDNSGGGPGAARYVPGAMAAVGLR